MEITFGFGNLTAALEVWNRKQLDGKLSLTDWLSGRRIVANYDSVVSLEQMSTLQLSSPLNLQEMFRQ
jgi:hypothetical protein